MLSEKCDLLEQINVHLVKKWNKKNGSTTNLRGNNKSKKKIHHLASSDYLASFKNENSIEKLEQRVKSLENCNNQLIQLINSLIEYLPELIASGLHADQEAQTSLDNHPCLFEAFKEPENPICCEKDKRPCPTRRERDIIELLVKGFCAKEIANRLFISETTVVTHKKNLKEKFNAKNSVELISKVQHLLLKENEEK
jgi:DNA-binding NarL/FixJ family response regulator